MPRRNSKRKGKRQVGAVDVVPSARPTTAFAIEASGSTVPLNFVIMPPGEATIHWRVTKVVVDLCASTPVLLKVSIMGPDGVSVESRDIVVTQDIRTVTFRNSITTRESSTTPTNVATVSAATGTPTGLLVSGVCYGSYTS
jgi:hypothetical protein